MKHPTLTLLDIMRKADPDATALCTPGAPYLTYGDLLTFIHTDANLSRIGAKRGDLIAYVAPTGNSLPLYLRML